MTFVVDHRITSTCSRIADWPLCRVFLKNNANYPWLILIPRQENIQDIDQLPEALQHTLIQEISQLSSIVKSQFKPHKLNVGALGNVVSQLHIHIVARFTHDDVWPHGVWQEQKTKPYAEDVMNELIGQLKIQM